MSFIEDNRIRSDCRCCGRALELFAHRVCGVCYVCRNAINDLIFDTRSGTFKWNEQQDPEKW